MRYSPRIPYSNTFLARDIVEAAMIPQQCHSMPIHCYNSSLFINNSFILYLLVYSGAKFEFIILYKKKNIPLVDTRIVNDIAGAPSSNHDPA